MPYLNPAVHSRLRERKPRSRPDGIRKSWLAWINCQRKSNRCGEGNDSIDGQHRSPLLDRRGGAKRRGGCSSKFQTDRRNIIRILNNHPVCGFAAATPPIQEGQWNYGILTFRSTLSSPRRTLRCRSPLRESCTARSYEPGSSPGMWN